MKRHLLVKARRPVPSGRAAHFARVLPLRACLAHRVAPIRLAVRGSALPGCFARHCSPPTVFKKRIRERAQVLLLSQLTILCPRNGCAKLARHSRIGHKLAGPGQYSSASAYIPRPSPVRVLPIAFPRPHTFPIRVQSVTLVRPQSVRSMSGECPHSVRQLTCLACERCIVGSASRAFPKHVSSAIQDRAGRPLGFWSPAAAFPSLPVRRTFLLAFRVVFLASSGGRPNFSGCVLRSGVAVLPLGALAAAPGCVQMLRIFCPVPATFAPSAWPWCARAVPRGNGQPKTESE
jgi:hypothetical protein